MKEKELINIIKSTLNSSFIGDDCAYLKDLGIVITQDSLVEDIHFKTDYTTPFKLGWKAAAVNISDICASGAAPKYLTIALSLPKEISCGFAEEFYKGVKAVSKDVQVVGGDITGSDKIFISVTAIGRCGDLRISSRSNARPGQKIIVSGEHGSSGAGLRLLMNGQSKPQKFLDAHLLPVPQFEFSKQISENIKEDYAMMDTSDGLMDALSQVAGASNVNLFIDFDKIPFDKDLKMFKDYRDLIFFGGEDYQLIAAVPPEIAKNFTIIGEVRHGFGVTVKFKNEEKLFTQEEVEEKLFNHFKNEL
ncbi:thiamine-phosphate kinase [bacterium]|nr:thiamine-phosphate kinase [bacterium]